METVSTEPHAKLVDLWPPEFVHWMAPPNREHAKQQTFVRDAVEIVELGGYKIPRATFDTAQFQVFACKIQFVGTDPQIFGVITGRFISEMDHPERIGGLMIPTTTAG